MKHFFYLLIVITGIVSCTPIPKVQERKSTKIPVGPGPEDIVIDTISATYPRLLVSCYQRRKELPPFSEICEVNLTDNSYKILKRTNEPQGMVFRPHGFDLVKNNQGELLLYCVSHNDPKNEHYIIVYKVFADRLEFKAKMNSPVLVSPNDVTANCNGEIFVTNDAGKRGSVMEQFLKLKRSNVVRYNPETQQWLVVASGFSYANGVALNHCPTDTVVFSTIRSNKLFLMQASKQGKSGYKTRKIARLKGLDNVTYISNNEILVTAHLRQAAFLNHYKDAKNNSPTVVYKVNISTGKSKAVYANNGAAISGGSTALMYKGKMYISQVFEPFLLKCDAEDVLGSGY